MTRNPSSMAGNALLPGRNVDRAARASQTRSRWRVLEPLVRGLVGALLLAAALAKAHEGITSPAPGERWGPIVQVQAEWFLGLWLLSGWLPRASRGCAIVLFAVFLVVTLGSAWRGETDCGCFGKLKVSPFITAGIDLLALAALILTQPLARRKIVQPGSPPMTRRMTLLGVFLLVALPGAGAGAGLGVWLMAAAEPARLSQEGMIQGSGPVIVEPAGWEARRLPLLAHIDIQERLAAGRWTVILVHHDCERCRETVSDMLKSDVPREEGSIALIETPPYAPAELWPNVLGDQPPENGARRVVLGRLSAEHDWFVETPLLFALEEGIVQRVRHAHDLARDQKVSVEPSAPSNESERGDLPTTKVRLGDTLPAAPITHELGYLEPGEVRQGRFVLENILDRAVTISRIQIECSCTEVTDTATPITIKPKGHATIPFTFTAPEVKSHYAKRIILHTDHPTQGTVALAVSARIGLPLVAEPAVVRFEGGEAGNSQEQFITLRNEGREPVRILYATSTHPAFVAKVPRLTLEPGGQGRIPITMTPPGGESHPTRKLEARVTLHTSLRAQPTVTVTVDVDHGAAQPD